MADQNQDHEVWTVEVQADTSRFEDSIKAATVSGKQFSSALVSAFDGVVVKGKGLGDTLKSLASTISDLVLKAALQPLGQGFSSALSGLFAGGGASALGFAKGGVFAGGLPVPFASGGIIQSPVTFPLGSGQTGLAGERGPEAILPLTRGPDGKLGIVAQGGGGPAVSVNFNVTATDADSFRRSEAQLSAMLARAVSLGQRNL